MQSDSTKEIWQGSVKKVPQLIAQAIAEYNTFNSQAIIFSATQNPFSKDFAQLIFNLAEPVDVKINVFDNIGNKVKNLVDAKLKRGHHQVTWNLLNENNQPIVNGIYFYAFSTPEMHIVKKIIILR
jgi:superfamily II DNA/RNA helicase